MDTATQRRDRARGRRGDGPRQRPDDGPAVDSAGPLVSLAPRLPVRGPGRVRVVLPAYNEERTLPSLLERLDRAFHEARLQGDVLVVNDGSTDGTAAAVRQFRGRLAVHPLDLQPNRGLAEAIRVGLLAAIEQADDDDIIITMDADNSHAPGLIPRMVQMIREGSDVVIASRYQPGARVRGVPPFRQILSLGASVLFRLVARVPGVRDYTCGFRAYRAGLLRSAFERYPGQFIRQAGFSCMAEILLKLKAMTPIIHEVPMILRYDLKRSASKMNVGRTIGETLLMLLRESLWRA
jgi:dolichol-phosphate mannosyltransferase